MGFGWPTRYWQLDLSKCNGGSSSWDKSVLESSDEYNHRVVKKKTRFYIKIHFCFKNSRFF